MGETMFRTLVLAILCLVVAKQFEPADEHAPLMPTLFCMAAMVASSVLFACAIVRGAL